MTTVDKQRYTESYDVNQVIELVKQLSHSQGFTEDYLNGSCI